MQAVDACVRRSCDKHRDSTVPALHELLAGFEDEMAALVRTAQQQWRELSDEWLIVFTVMAGALAVCDKGVQFRDSAAVNFYLNLLEVRGQESALISGTSYPFDR